MASGYFNDGQTHVELGAHVHGVPAIQRSDLIFSPPGRSACVLDQGGGVLDVSVTGQRLRDNLGDAERYLHDLMLALACSEPGVLGWEDNRGHRCTFGDAVCVRAEGRVSAMRFAELRCTFACPEAVSQPEWGSVPDVPAAYDGTSTAQDYAANGLQIGAYPVSLRIAMTRAYPLRPVPRARGARSRGPVSGAVLRLTVHASHRQADGSLPAALVELERQIGPGFVALTGNGNSYPNCFLSAVRPVPTDGDHTTFEAEFVRRI